MVGVTYKLGVLDERLKGAGFRGSLHPLTLGTKLGLRSILERQGFRASVRFLKGPMTLRPVKNHPDV